MTRDYCDSVLDIGAKPLRRRDRAALVLALECLRWYPRDAEADDALRDASDALRLPMWEIGPRTNVGAALHEAAQVMWQDDSSCRLIRARLALLLRVLLRVDAGDYKWRQVPIDPWGWRPARPLWELAETHSPTVTPKMRRGW